jgi:hypothetical protein
MLSFSQYIESKNILRMAVEDATKIKRIYYVTKYCKLPVYEDLENNNKDYISLKPRDVIEITWEKDNDNLVARFICINEGQKLFPSWSISKFNSWVESTCILI